MNLKDKIRNSSYWKGREPFTSKDMALLFNVRRTQITYALREMEDEFDYLPRKCSNGTTIHTYCRKADAAKWLSMPWVSPEWVWRGFGPREWV